MPWYRQDKKMISTPGQHCVTGSFVEFWWKCQWFDWVRPSFHLPQVQWPVWGGRTELAHPASAPSAGLLDPASSLPLEGGRHYRHHCCHHCCWHLHHAHGYLDDKALPSHAAKAKNWGSQLQLWPLLCGLACSSPQQPALLSMDSPPYLLGRKPSARTKLEQNSSSSSYCCPIPPPIHPFPILVCHFPLHRIIE